VLASERHSTLMNFRLLGATLKLKRNARFGLKSDIPSSQRRTKCEASAFNVD
jgi:hypothetical protein